MSDRAKDTPCLTLSEPWREVFLARFTMPAAAAALARIGDLLRTLALEHGHCWLDRGESCLRADLRAVGRDASFFAYFLREEIAAHRRASALSEEDYSLAALAAELAPLAGSIAGRVAAQVGPAPRVS